MDAKDAGWLWKKGMADGMLGMESEPRKGVTGLGDAAPYVAGWEFGRMIRRPDMVMRKYLLDNGYLGERE